MAGGMMVSRLAGGCVQTRGSVIVASRRLGGSTHTLAIYHLTGTTGVAGVGLAYMRCSNSSAFEGPLGAWWAGAWAKEV